MKNTTNARNGNDVLWQNTMDALYAGKWGVARQGLDDLIYYHGDAAVDMFPCTRDLPVACPEYLRAVIDDRVELWNSKVERRFFH